MREIDALKKALQRAEEAEYGPIPPWKPPVKKTQEQQVFQAKMDIRSTINSINHILTEEEIKAAVDETLAYLKSLNIKDLKDIDNPA